MARYFDIESPGDLALILPAEFRKWSELSVVVDLVEDEILERYTRRRDPLELASEYPDAVVSEDAEDVAVFLKGYSNTPAETDAALVTALKRTIALVTTWRIRSHRKDPMVHSQHTTEGKFTRYLGSASDDFPENWNRFLRRFDLRPPLEYL